MATRRGAPRKLTDVQVQRILEWHAQGKAFRRAHGTRLQLAQHLCMSVHTLNAYIAHLHPLKSSESHPGRPRRLTDQQLAEVFVWHRAYQQHRVAHGTQVRLARELGVSPATIQHCIRCSGRYETYPRVTAAPQRRSRAVGVSNSARRLSSVIDRDNQVRNALLRGWRVIPTTFIRQVQEVNRHE